MTDSILIKLMTEIIITVLAYAFMYYLNISSYIDMKLSSNTVARGNNHKDKITK